MTKEQNNEVNVLDELNKGACMGRDAIHFILDKVNDEKLKKVLLNQYDKYKEMTDKIAKTYPEYAQSQDQEPHQTNAVTKAMTWYNIEMKTITDDSTSKIAELLLQGTNMGIIEGRRLLNHKDVDEVVHNMLQEYVDMQEEIVVDLKKFL